MGASRLCLRLARARVRQARGWLHWAADLDVYRASRGPGDQYGHRHDYEHRKEQGRPHDYDRTATANDPHNHHDTTGGALKTDTCEHGGDACRALLPAVSQRHAKRGGG